MVVPQRALRRSCRLARALDEALLQPDQLMMA
jgi:hypothetical protein